MPIPYDSFPTNDVWRSDSTVSGIMPSTWRVTDTALGVIDALVAHCNDVNFQDVRIETLFFLVKACDFWLNKLNKVPANKGQPLDHTTGHGLPSDRKVSGHDDRRSAISALKMISGDLLMNHTHMDSVAAAMTSLEPLFVKSSHGGTADAPGPDQLQIQQVRDIGEVAIFLQEAHLQRRYKLRFRGGVAWRWSPAVNTNAIYDSTNNVESESNDQKTHFVMNSRGHIYAGFDKNAFWFKHSSLIGGANAYSAGRMRIVAGRVVHVENDSGHYHPGIQQMRNLLHRLRLYGANIDDVVVRRIQPGPAANFTGAQIIVSRATWPDGVAG